MDGNIRRATAGDVSRIAEISVFAKRVNYRSIFHNDRVSFGEIQVLGVAQALLDAPELLSRYWVYDDEFVKGFIHVRDREICELYVEPFFAGQGVGGALIDFAVREFGASRLWVLEKNPRAIAFYQRHGFALSGESQCFPGTPEIICEMIR